MTTTCQAPAASYDYEGHKALESNDLQPRGGYTARVQTTGQRIRKEREALGWVLEDLAAASGVDRVTLNRIELGKQRPHKSTLRSIDTALHSARLREVEDVPGSSGESGGARIEDRLADLFVYIKTLDDKARGEFVRGLIALLDAIEHARPSASSGTPSDDGR